MTDPATAVGEWHGELAAAGNRLRVGLSVEAGPDGALAGRLTSPDQTPRPIPLDKVTLEDGTLRFESASLHARFEGRWDAVAGAWSGTFTQGGALPLVLAKGPVPPRTRPQTPRPPFPYREEQVAFESVPGVRLAGTLTLPPGRGPFPAAVMITGSGQQDRDETLFDHKPFAVIADALARKGVAVLRYDDRGFGQSTGSVAEATSRDFALDAQAAAAFLRGRPDIDPRRVGLIGHSEGGLIAPMVAVAEPRTAFIVLLAGPGVPGAEAMAAQRQAIGRAMGLPPEAIARNEAVMTRLDRAAPDEAARIIAEAPPPAAAQMKATTSPWYRWFITYDPAPTLRQVKAPVLALNGERDLQVLPDLNLAGLKAALRDNPDATFVELPGLNHLFQASATGDPRDYARIDETIAPAALDAIVDWVAARTGSLR